MAVREIPREEVPVLDLVGGMGTTRLADIMCPAALIGISGFDLRWFANEENEDIAGLALYEGVRLFPQFPNTPKAKALGKDILYAIAAELPDAITIVGREHHILIPPGFERSGEQTKHYKMVLRMKDYPHTSESETANANIRLLTLGDLLCIKDLLLYDEHQQIPSKRMLKRLATLPYYGYFEGDLLLAISGCYGIDSQREYIANLGDVFVHPDHRGKGIGTAVVRRTLDDFRASGVKTVACDTGVADEPHMPDGKPVINHLLKKLGFSFYDWIYYQDAVRKST